MPHESQDCVLTCALVPMSSSQQGSALHVAIPLSEDGLADLQNLSLSSQIIFQELIFFPSDSGERIAP
jgi:hypothetical protein